MAAGYATRLYPLTKEYPKPLLEVDGRPIIDYIVSRLEAAGLIDEIVVVANSKFIPLFRKWAKARKRVLPISLVDDLTSTLQDRLGAIGDMQFAIAKKRIKDETLVIGGDNLFDGDIREFIEFVRSKSNSPAIGVYDVRDKLKVRHYGVVSLNAEKRIIDFQEKPKRPKSTLAAMCLYYFPGDKLGLVKKYLDDKDAGNDTTGSYIRWLKDETPVYAYIFAGRWYDIGSHKFLNEAKEKFNN